MNFLKNPVSAPASRLLLWCNIVYKYKVRRSKLYRHYVPRKEFLYEECPPFCRGAAVFFTPDSMMLLYRQSQNFESPIFSGLDDVHVTGTLAKQINLEHTSLLPYMLSEANMNRILNGDNVGYHNFLMGPLQLENYQIEALHNYVEKMKKEGSKVPQLVEHIENRLNKSKILKIE